MDKYTQGRVDSQVRRACQCRRQILEDQDLCFTELLPKEQIEAAIDRHKVRYRERLYTPLVTIWTFLYQVLAPDQSCRAAVARLLAFLCVGGNGSGSAKTDPYCKARGRLPEELLADLARSSGGDLQREVPSTKLLGGRTIKIADGTTVSMADTPANQKTYPQQSAQKEGLGFPIMRMVGLISLSCGAVLDVAMAPYSGKKTGETTLIRQLLNHLKSGEILLADAIFSNYWTIALVLRRGVDFVGHHDGRRLLDFRKGQRLGRCDHIVSWQKPAKQWWMSKKLYRSLPETLRIRELKVEITQKGFRSRHLLLVTTLLDAERYSKQELAMVYRARWHAELDLRSIKQVMQMDVLRCKSPAMVRKEVWMHLLAYNLIRKLMAQAAARAEVCPRDISFKGTLQTLLAFAAAGWSCPERRNELYCAVLEAVATHRVNDRPDRVEPRAVKRRPKKQVYLNEPRSVAKERLLNRT
ncbi:MAG: IS4 family transposase [Planctomycetes bacterium]|nr:IS4 family transposase [Planctomycetota bacterium]